MKQRNKAVVSTAEAADLLGVSVATLHRLKANGIFNLGRNKHYWVVNPTAARFTYRWNVKNCVETLEKLERMHDVK